MDSTGADAEGPRNNANRTITNGPKSAAAANMTGPWRTSAGTSLNRSSSRCSIVTTTSLSRTDAHTYTGVAGSQHRRDDGGGAPLRSDLLLLRSDLVWLRSVLLVLRSVLLVCFPQCCSCFVSSTLIRSVLLCPLRYIDGPMAERPDWGHATDLEDVSGRAAIAGVGESAYTKASGRTAREIGA